MGGSLPWPLARRGNRAVPVLVMLAVLAVLLELAAGTGLAYVAGFSAIRTVLGRVDWVWLPALCGSLAVSFAGYYHAYRGIFTVDGGPALRRAQLWAVAAAGFGGFLAHGFGDVDKYVLEAAGAKKAEARVRVTALGGLEQGVLAIGGCLTAITVLADRARIQPDFTVPWAVVPVPAFLISFWAAERYRSRFSRHSGWRGPIGTFLDSVHLIRRLFTEPLRWGWGWLGMALFWAADAFAVWAGLAMFGYAMNGAALFVGFATGMVFTRRIGPLAGAGVLALVLPVTIWCCGAPLAVAIAGVFAYRILAFWLPMPLSLAAMPTLRTMGERLPRQS
jgi:hypothetical protein